MNYFRDCDPDHQTIIMGGSHYPGLGYRESWVHRSHTGLAEYHFRHMKLITGLLRDMVIPKGYDKCASWTDLLYSKRSLNNFLLSDCSYHLYSDQEEKFKAEERQTYTCHHGVCSLDLDRTCQKCDPRWTLRVVVSRISHRWWYFKTFTVRRWIRRTTQVKWVPRPYNEGVS